MARFCDACGTPCADNATFCAGCGKPLAPQAAPQQPQYQAPQQPYQAPQQPQYQAPQQPQYQAPQQPYQAPQQPQYGYQPTPQYQQQQPQYGYQQPRPAQPVDFVGMIRQYLKFIIAIVAVFALLGGIFNLFGIGDVSGTVKYGSQSSTGSGPLSDLRENFMEQIPVYIISTYVMGIVGLAAAACLGYATYLLFVNAPGSRKFFTYGALILGVGSLICLLMGLFGGSSDILGVKMSYGVPWTYWVCTILGLGLIAIDKGLFKQDARPLQ